MHLLKTPCCFIGFVAGGHVVFAFNVRCIRSCCPFCCGLPGSINSGRMPNLIHQTDSCDSLPKAVEANGVPLSDRIAFGRPYFLNRRVNTSLAPKVSVESRP